MALYQLSFNDDFATRDQITAHLDKDRTHIQDWYYCMSNTIFIASTYSSEALRKYIEKLNTEQKRRFFISGIYRLPNYDGWLPKSAWEFINKYMM